METDALEVLQELKRKAAAWDWLLPRVARVATQKGKLNTRIMVTFDTDGGDMGYEFEKELELARRR